MITGLLKGFDNKWVNLLNNACGIMPLSTVKRWGIEAHAEKDVPSLIQVYNQLMGGIDLSDMQDPSKVKAMVLSPVRFHP